MNIERIESGPAYAGASFDELRITQSEIYEREQSAMRSILPARSNAGFTPTGLKPRWAFFLHGAPHEP